MDYNKIIEIAKKYGIEVEEKHTHEEAGFIYDNSGEISKTLMTPSFLEIFPAPCGNTWEPNSEENLFNVVYALVNSKNDYYVKPCSNDSCSMPMAEYSIENCAKPKKYYSHDYIVDLSAA